VARELQCSAVGTSAGVRRRVEGGGWKGGGLGLPSAGETSRRRDGDGKERWGWGGREERGAEPERKKEE
jgi:hypothetical protein